MADGIKITVVGQEKFKGSMRRKDAKTTKLIREALNLSGLDVLTDARNSIVKGTRTGNTYVRYNPRREGIAGRRHKEPPKTDRGILVGSIFREPKNPTTEVRVGTRLNYGRALELNGWAWLAPAFERQLDRVRLRIRNALKGIR